MNNDRKWFGIICIVMILFFTITSLVVVVVSVVQSSGRKEKASDIFDKYVAIAREENGLSAVEKINLESELKELGYTNVEIKIPEIDTTGDYPILVIISKENLRGAKINEVVFKESIKIK